MRPRRILVTGAAGFLGHALATALLDDPALGEARLVLLDSAPIRVAGERVEPVQGDLTDACVLDAAIADGVDLVYHLAGVVGGAAEADYALARRINVDATLTLFERLRDTALSPRVVFASSIAVFGERLPLRVDDNTLPQPTMTYAAQKFMMEIALAQFSARGWVNGLSLRIPAVVAKPAVPGVKPVFLNGVFHAFAAGNSMTMPVSPSGTAWLLSHSACVAALLHAAGVPSSEIGPTRTITLPALRVEMRELVAALARRHPGAETRIGFAPDAAIEAQFAAQPPLSTGAADRLGFRHDGDIDRLVECALSGAPKREPRYA